jgi:hypothetical protein
MHDWLLLLHKGLVTRASRPTQGWYVVWLGLSFAIAALYGGLALYQAVGSAYVIQDDARQHVFWMRRFLNPDLFPNDWIADYFQSVAPIGYRSLYYGLAQLGADPVAVSKGLPLVLGLITTGYCFGLCLQILPLPVAGVGASVLLNQILWTHDDLASATPRAFIYPLLTAFLYYLLKRSLLPCWITLGLQAMFYPQAVLISGGMLAVQGLRWRWPWGWPWTRREGWLCGVGLGLAIALLLPYVLQPSAYGPVLTLAEAQNLPEFQPGGRAAFFTDQGAAQFWLWGGRSGLLPRADRLPPLLWAGLLLPLLLGRSRWFPLGHHRPPHLLILGQLVGVSLLWFGLAHLALFRLHLPNRYTQHTLRIGLALAAALALVLILDGLLHWAEQTRATHQGRSLVAMGLSGAIALALLLFPLTVAFPRVGYVTGAYPDLYAFFAQQPTDIVIASIAEEASNLPSFSQRTVLTAREYGIPYHQGYYQGFVERTLAVVTAQYSDDLDTVAAITQQYGITFWLLDRHAFREDYLRQSWVWQYPDTVRPIQRSLRHGSRPILKTLHQTCAVFENSSLLVLDAACVLEQGRALMADD